MPFKKGNKQGVTSGGGGRKSLTDEQIKAKVINKSWYFLKKVLDDEKGERKEKFQISLEVAKKTIPKEIKLDDKREKIATNPKTLAKIKEFEEKLKEEL